MRNVLVLIFGLGVWASVGLGEGVGAYYYGRQGQTDVRGVYRGQQAYYYQGQYRGGHGTGQSQFGNRWQVGGQYQLDAYGRPIAAGQMGTSGVAQRGYVHQNQPSTLESIDRREAAIQQQHVTYLKNTQSSYQTIAERQMENARLQGSRYERDQQRIRTNNSFIQINQTLLRIESNMHGSVINGSDRSLPPVR